MSFDTVVNRNPQRYGTLFDVEVSIPQSNLTCHSSTNLFYDDGFYDSNKPASYQKQLYVNPLYSSNIQRNMEELLIDDFSPVKEEKPLKQHTKNTIKSLENNNSNFQNYKCHQSHNISESLPNKKIQTGRFTISVSPSNSSIDVSDDDENSISVTISKIRPQKSSTNLFEHKAFPVKKKLAKAQSESRFKFTLCENFGSPPRMPMQPRSFTVDVSVESQHDIDEEKRKTLQFFDDLINF